MESGVWSVGLFCDDAGGAGFAALGGCSCVNFILMNKANSIVKRISAGLLIPCCFPLLPLRTWQVGSVTASRAFSRWSCTAFRSWTGPSTPSPWEVGMYRGQGLGRGGAGNHPSHADVAHRPGGRCHLLGSGASPEAGGEGEALGAAPEEAARGATDRGEWPTACCTSTHNPLPTPPPTVTSP